MSKGQSEGSTRYHVNLSVSFKVTLKHKKTVGKNDLKELSLDTTCLVTLGVSQQAKGVPALFRCV